MDELTENGLVTFESRINRAIVGALRGQDLSGFEIWRWLASGEGTAGLLTEAELYPTLYRLEADHLLAGDWHEGERTRRKYRLTATALELADERGWPALAFMGSWGAAGEHGIRATPGAPSAPTSTPEPQRTARTRGPDPESGSWFMPPTSEPARIGTTTETPSEAPPLASPTPAPGDDRSQRSAAIARYADDLVATLDLPRSELDGVRQEITDHLADTASALAPELDRESATTEALNRLGPARALARRIESAEHTRDRRDRAIRRGVIEFVGEIVLWLVLSTVALVLAPGISDLVTALGRVAGIHLTVLRSAEWATNQMAITVCVGAFAAGRLSLGYLARISHHSDAAFRKPWALGGAAVVLAVVLILPGYQDTLVVATLLAAPIAFVAGTFHPKHLNESAYSIRGVIAAALVVAAIILLPAGRLFVYDPNGTPGTPLAAGEAFTYVSVLEHPDGSFDYTAPSAATGDYKVELWAASTDGLYIVVDRSASGPAFVASGAVDLTKLPPSQQWWVVAVRTDPNGQRTAIAVVIQTGASPRPGTALGWLLSKL